MNVLKVFILSVFVYGCVQIDTSERTTVEQNVAIQNAADTLTIKNIIEIQRKRKNFEERESIWAEDGRWLQAFGRVFNGKDSIISFIKVLHNNPGWSESSISSFKEPEIKFLRPDVAVVHQYHEREGQVINGIVTPTRRINTTYILTKEDGTWLLRDKVTMDERERTKN